MRATIEAVQAGCVFPVSSSPIPHGIVLAQEGIILDILPPDAELPSNVTVRDLGNVALTPAWINAHAHLELSDLMQPLGSQGLSLADWIPLVLQHRGRDSHDPIAAIRKGLREATAAQTAAIGDILPLDLDLEKLLSLLDEDEDLISGTAFFELIGWNSERVFETTSQARLLLNAAESLLPKKWRTGLSPHAPHTVASDLLRWAVTESAKRDIPIAMHLAETKDEIRLLRSGSGPLRELMAGIGPYPFEEIREGNRPLDYLRVLSKASKPLVIHGNYLNDKEIEFLGAERDNMSVVYCPRSHAHFGHDPYPLQQMLDAGVRVAIGTDGRASVPNLNICEELCFCAMQHPTVSKRLILEMGTLSGAQALGVDDQLGTLAPGKSARWAVSSLDMSRQNVDPHDCLFSH
jgi:aminodeoxyfutalosine deaminase